LAGLTINDKTLLRQMSSVPAIAWPTLVLFLGAFVLWIATLATSLAGTLPSWLAVITAFVAIYCLYMAMHEASHGSLAKDRRFNAFVGNLASIPFMGAFPLYRHAHRRHHSHTNSAQDDPDFWSGGRPLLLRWLTQDLRYVHIYHNSSRHFSPVEKVQNVVQPALCLVAMIALAVFGSWQTLLFAWILPWRLAITWLAFSFNYLPHTPHDIEQSRNRFAATSCRRPRWLKWILLFQNYHIIHHLYPTAPFYRIEKMWDIGADYFREHGTRIV